MPGINSISFDSTGWKEAVVESEKKIWVDDSRDEMILEFLNGRSEIRVNLDDIDDIRGLYRKIALKNQGGIVEVDVKSVSGIIYVHSITKFPQPGHGIRYSGGVAISFENFGYALSILAQELGITGTRETLLSQKLNFPSRKAWAQDPYLPKFRKGLLRTLADDVKWDESFPDHPLSRVRKKLDIIESSLELNQELLSTEKYISADVSRHVPRSIWDKIRFAFQ